MRDDALEPTPKVMPYNTLYIAAIIIVIQLVIVISSDSSIQSFSEVVRLLARKHFGGAESRG